MSENAFFRDTESLYEQSLKLNCKGVNCLDNNYLTANKEELKKNINCSANNTRNIRNVDFERPMMWCEYRFKHLNYCNHVNINGFTVCKDCTNCGFSKNLNLNDPIVREQIKKQ
jgi:hypothetical protein